MEINDDLKNKILDTLALWANGINGFSHILVFGSLFDPTFEPTLSDIDMAFIFNQEAELAHNIRFQALNSLKLNRGELEDKLAKVLKLKNSRIVASPLIATTFEFEYDIVKGIDHNFFRHKKIGFYSLRNRDFMPCPFSESQSAISPPAFGRVIRSILQKVQIYRKEYVEHDRYYDYAGKMITIEDQNFPKDLSRVAQVLATDPENPSFDIDYGFDDLKGFVKNVNDNVLFDSLVRYSGMRTRRKISIDDQMKLWEVIAQQVVAKVKKMQQLIPDIIPDPLSEENRNNQLQPLASGGQVNLLVCTASDGQKLVVKKLKSGVSNKIKNPLRIEKNNQIPYAVQIKEVIPDKDSIVMNYYSEYDYCTLHELIAFKDATMRLKAAHSILQKLIIYLIFALEDDFLPHTDLNPRNILIRKNLIEKCMDGSDDLFEIDDRIFNYNVINYFSFLKVQRKPLLKDDSVVVINSWHYDGRYDAGHMVIPWDYHSPEQLDLETNVNYNSDLYQVGLLYYILLAGNPNDPQALHPLGSINTTIPSQFEQVLRGLTQTDQSRRFTLFNALQAITWAKLYYTDRSQFINEKNRELLPVRPGILKDFEKNVDLRVKVNNNKSLTVLSLTPLLTKECPEIVINIKDSNQRFVVPSEIVDVTKDWIKDRVEREMIRQENDFDKANLFFNGDQIRIDSLKYYKSDRLEVNIKTSRTKFYDEKMTNEFCNRFIASGETVYERFGGSYQDLSDSQLANPLAVNFIVVTSDGYLLICKRGKLANNLNMGANRQIPLVPTVSGTIDPANCIDANGVFHLNKAVMSEYEEEVFNGHAITDDQIVYLGFARTFAFLYPFVYGMIFSGKTRYEHEHADRSKNGIIECHGWEYVKNSIQDIADWMKNRVNQTNPDGTYFNTSDTLFFHLYRYCAWLNMKSDYPISQAEFDKLFNPAGNS
jgi:hypothetical protein